MGDATVRAEAEEAITQVDRLGGVITSLLARARGDAVPPVDLDLSRLVASGCSPWTRLLAREGRALHARIQPKVEVRARPDHLLTVLGSLLDNALVHGSGAVTVQVRGEPQAAVLTVADEGPGVARELVDVVFERRISGGRGTGIGLGLARSLVAAEGGTLRLEGASCFAVTLPRTPTAPDATGEA
jgi:signal transduction histidine kinase